jgi:hypothetical protein
MRMGQNIFCPCHGLSRCGEVNAPEMTRTSDPRFRKPLLYPLSYEGTFAILPWSNGLTLLDQAIQLLGQAFDQ